MPGIAKTQNAATLLKRATYASTATAGVLIVVKLGVWFMTGSLSILASLVDSVMDIAASLINLFAVRYSLRSADRDHQFGHGKAESLAGLGQASFICGSAIFLLFHAVERLKNPQPLEAVGLGMSVLAFAILITLALIFFQGYVVRRTQSTAIRADALHYKTDLLTNMVGIGVLFSADFGWDILDPLCAVAIACFILYSAWQVGSDAMQILMDRELPGPHRQAICDIALEHKDVLGLHDLRTRLSGQTMVIQLHLDLDRNLPLFEAHAVTKTVEMELLANFPGSDILIHEDPVDPDTYRYEPLDCE